MILDWKNGVGPIHEYQRGKVFVDGTEINRVFYVDTERGIVKTYDVLHNDAAATPTRKPDGTFWTAADFPGREVEAPEDGVLEETIRGTVRVEKPEAR